MLALSVLLGPFQTAFAHQQAQVRANHALVDLYLHADREAIPALDVDVARRAFEDARLRATRCAPAVDHPSDYVRCLFDALESSRPVRPVAEPSPVEASTLSSVLAERRGNCAAIAAAILALDSPRAALVAVILPRHVLLRFRTGSQELFEPLDRGSPRDGTGLAANELRIESVVSGDAFLAYYLDNLAVRLAQAGDADAAERAFRSAVAAGPRVGRVRFNFGTFLLGRSRLDEAINELRHAVRLDNRNADAWANLGVAHAKVEDLKRARKCFEHALRIDPHHEVARANIALLAHGATP